MIDITKETPLSLAQAAKALPGRPHLSTVWRFATRGVRGVRLNSFMSGGRRFTSVEEIHRFILATTAAAGIERQPKPLEHHQNEADELARQDLYERGFFGPRNKERRVNRPLQGKVGEEEANR